MKKTFKLLFVVSLFVLCVLMLASCGEKLDKPTGIVLDKDTLTVSWNKVPHAKSYTIQIEGSDRDRNTKSNFISLEYLEEGVYEVKIKAVGSGDYRDSDWIKYEFKRPEENGLRYSLINGDTAYAVTNGGSAEGDVVIPDTYRDKPVVAIADKAFYNNSKITSIDVGNNVTSIGEKAFTKSSNLVSVTLRDNVTSIGSYAFQNCKLLESITIPDGVTVIEPFTFSRCEVLKTVDIGDSIISIGEYAFSSCKALASMVIPNTTTYIGEYAFSDCTAMNTLVFGTNVEEIDAYAFYNCSAVEAINLGPNVKYIRSEAFGNCATVTSITIPDSTERIEYGAFGGCTAITEIKLGAGLTRIGSEVFKGTKPYEDAETLFCIDGWLLEVKDKTIEELEIPAGVYGLADFAVSACKSLESIDIEGVKYVGRASFYNCIALWEVIFDDALLVIGENAFRDCKKLTDITLEEGLEKIDSYAFMNCAMLYEMDIPDSVKTIGGYAFYGSAKYKTTKSGVIQMDDWAVGCAAPSLTVGYYDAVNIDESVRAIANYAFYGIPIAYTYIPDSVKIIGKGAFYGNAFPFASGMRVRLSQELEYIGDYAFYKCSNWFFGEGDEPMDLVTLDIPDTVTYIGRSAFYNCSSIVTINIPGSVKTIGKYAFYNCSNVGQSNLVADEDEGPLRGEITLGEGIQYIGAQAFRNCIGIESLVIPSTVTYIGEKAFFNCAKLNDLTIGSGLTEINDYLFYKCISLETVTIPDSVKEIGAFAFRGNTSLTSVDLGSVEVIGHHAFLGCSALKSVNLPTSVTDVREFAFRGCTAATSVLIPDSVTNVGKHAFYGMASATLFVESTAIPQDWDSTYNSTFRPVVLGCDLSDSSDYVDSFVNSEATVLNSNAFNGLNAPARDGYTFVGWTCDGTQYSASEVVNAPSGSTVYAVWEETTDN